MTHRILVVDDDPLVLRSVERSLLRAGFTVHAAKGRADALAVAQGAELDLALVDFALGRDDGLELLGILRERAPHCLRVLMTGNRDFPVVVEAVNRGEVVRVLNKPFQPAELVALVRGAIDADRRRDERATQKLIEGAMVERRALEDCLRRKSFQIAVQPIVEVRRGKPSIVAYEALLRPRHSAFPSVVELLMVAERSGKLGELGVAVMALAARWLARIPEEQGLFVNLHPAQLGELDTLQRSLAPMLDQASRVTLEITERARMQDIAGWEQSVAWITESGFSLAVDDLGAGYNSLSMLADLSPSHMKIDMNLIRGIDADQRKQRLIQLLITFAEATEIRTVAEGVETAAEARCLEELGVRLMQGHFFGRPDFELSGGP